MFKQLKNSKVKNSWFSVMRSKVLTAMNLLVITVNVKYDSQIPVAS